VGAAVVRAVPAGVRSWDGTLDSAYGREVAEPAIFTAADFAVAPQTVPDDAGATDELLAWMAWLGRSDSRPATLSAERYDALAAAFNRQALAVGCDKRAPRARRLLLRFRSWPEARAQAGLCTTAQSSARRQGQYFTRHQLLDACAKALLARGLDMQTREYDAWSDGEVPRLIDRGDPRPAVPRADTLRRRLGGPDKQWSVAIEETLRCRPALARRLGA
jgi:hypothetical protein